MAIRNPEEADQVSRVILRDGLQPVDIKAIKGRMGDAVPLTMEYGIYVFILLMFGGRLSTVRELAVYLPALLWLLRSIGRKTLVLEWKEPLFIVVLALFLSAAVSSLINSGPVGSFLLLRKEYIEIVLLYCVISTTFVSPGKLRRLALVLAVTGTIYLVLGFHKIVTDLLKSGSIDYDRTRYYATIILFFLPFILFENDRSRGPAKVLWKAPLLGSVAGILLTGVRGSWLGLLGVLGLWMYFLRERYRNVLIILTAGAAGVAVIILIIVALFPGEYKFVKGHIMQKTPVSYRIETWKLFIRLSGERSLLGHGIDNDAMSEHYKESYKALNGSYPAEDKPITPHNQFIRTLYQQGIIGLAIYALLFLVLFYRVIRRFLSDRDNELSLFGISVAASVLGEYVIRCMTEDRSMIPLGLLLSMAGAYLNLKKDGENG